MFSSHKLIKIMNRIGINPNHCCTLLNRSPCSDDFQDIITFQICWVIFLCSDKYMLQVLYKNIFK